MASSSHSIKIAFKMLTDDAFEIIEEEIVNLHNDLIDVGEKIHDTRNFKNSFSPIQKVSKWHWRIENDAEYADILSRGRRVVNGKAYGSLGWYHGISPMIQKTSKNIDRRVGNVHY